jgi:3-hydroxyacyl-CoA dehydrogenase / enoyl-CoA hydratase / 3-hydroxybutyryl-CoA epimerase
MTAAMSTTEPREGARAIARTEVRPDGVAVLTLDDPAEAHNTIKVDVMEALFGALARLDASGRVRAIVLQGKPGSFLAGANLDVVRALRFAKDAEDAAAEIARRFGHLARGGKPVVAYVHGPALGGGMELALACTAAVATTDRSTVLGLPEVKLGLMPAANGLLRVAERAGLRVAVDLGLTGRSLRARQAHDLGLVDEVVDSAVGLEAACALAKKLAERPEMRKFLPRRRQRAVRRGLRGVEQLLLERNPLGRSLLFRRARAEADQKTRGHYPAVARILDVLARWASHGFASAAELEARLFGELVVSETSHRLVELFFATTALKKDSGLEAGESARPARVEHVAVLGAGLMGAGIACVTVQAGLPVRMKDRDDLALGRGLRYVQEQLGRRRSLSARERAQAFGLLSGAVDYSGLRHADVVIEAVFEDLALKHEVLREVEKLVSTDCVIATNTSSLPIGQISQAAAHPERVVGMHYFSPVPKMPLLEVVRAPATDARAVATAVALGRRQGKAVIVVKDGTGFYTTRILAPYLHEAAHLLAEGVAIDAVDDALVDWGFTVGPLHLLDEVGLDVAVHVASVMHEAFGERMKPPSAMLALDADHRQGRKNGRGLYLHGRDGRRVDDTVYGTLGVTPKKKAMHDEIGLRCSLAMINEALRCHEEGVVRSARDADLGAILGLGFPAFRGGPLRYVDVIGPAEVLGRTRALEQRFGARFTPAPLLVEMARKAKRFYG